MKKVIVNGAAENIRELSPFAYKDTIKTLEKSNEQRVVLDGEKVRKSAVTKGRDVKGAGGIKHHLYFYPAAQGAAREWMPISAEEFRAYTNDPGFTFAITTVVAPAEAAPAEAPAAEAAPAEAPAEQPAEVATAEAEAPAPAPAPHRGRRAQR